MTPRRRGAPACEGHRRARVAAGDGANNQECIQRSLRESLEGRECQRVQGSPQTGGRHSRTQAEPGALAQASGREAGAARSRIHHEDRGKCLCCKAKRVGQEREVLKVPRSEEECEREPSRLPSEDPSLPLEKTVGFGVPSLGSD